jgi:hypothetical protein
MWSKEQIDTLVGTWTDPKHNGCYRTIYIADNNVMVSGNYGEDEASRELLGKQWKTPVTLATYPYLHVGFHGKVNEHNSLPHPQLAAVYSLATTADGGDTLLWADNNKWHHVRVRSSGDAADGGVGHAPVDGGESR